MRCAPLNLGLRRFNPIILPEWVVYLPDSAHFALTYVHWEVRCVAVSLRKEEDDAQMLCFVQRSSALSELEWTSTTRRNASFQGSQSLFTLRCDPRFYFSSVKIYRWIVSPRNKTDPFGVIFVALVVHSAERFFFFWKKKKEAWLESVEPESRW